MKLLMSLTSSSLLIFLIKMALKYLAYAAAALCTTTAVVLYLRSKSSPQDLITKTILTKESHIKITQKIREIFSMIYWKELKNARIERRKFQARSAQYETVVSGFQKKIKSFLEQAQAQVLKEYRVTKACFEDSINFYDSDPNFKQYGCDLVKPLPENKKKEVLSREETKEILTFYSERYKEYENDCPDLDEYMEINCEIEDEIYRIYKVEIEEVNAAFEAYEKEMEEIVEPLKNQTHYILESNDRSY